MSLVQGVVDLQGHPPLTSLVLSTTVPTALTNPHTVGGNLVPVSGGKPAYGIRWGSTSAPAGAGQASRGITVYELQFLSLAVFYTLPGPHEFVGAHLITGDANGVLMFDPPLPSRIVYSILHDWQTDFAWLVAP